jgi:hypothetical protein
VQGVPQDPQKFLNAGRNLPSAPQVAKLIPAATLAPVPQLAASAGQPAAQR